MEKLEVKVFCINEGQTGQYYGLKLADGSGVLHSAPNDWKTYKGAIRWALHHNMEVIED